MRIKQSLNENLWKKKGEIEKKMKEEINKRWNTKKFYLPNL